MICVLCDAFCSYTALPRVKGVHQPRDSAVFFSQQTATAAARNQYTSTQRAGTGGEGRKSSARLCTATVRRLGSNIASAARSERRAEGYGRRGGGGLRGGATSISSFANHPLSLPPPPSPSHFVLYRSHLTRPISSACLPLFSIGRSSTYVIGGVHYVYVATEQSGQNCMYAFALCAVVRHWFVAYVSSAAPSAVTVDSSAVISVAMATLSPATLSSPGPLIEASFCVRSRDMSSAVSAGVAAPRTRSPVMSAVRRLMCRRKEDTCSAVGGSVMAGLGSVSTSWWSSVVSVTLMTRALSSMDGDSSLPSCGDEGRGDSRWSSLVSVGISWSI